MTLIDEPVAPRENLVRMNNSWPCELRVSPDGDGRTLVGYAAMFNKPATINSWEGNFREVIAPGAFARTLKNNGQQIKVLFNHGMDPSIGDKPLGRAAEMLEDDRGLYIEVPLSRTSYNDDLIALLSDGAIDGMSFRFSVPKGGDTWDYPEKGLPTRTLTEVKLFELGPVTFPAYQATSAGVRSREEFSIWRDLPEDRQAAIFQIVTGTRSVESPAERTDDTERPAELPAEEVREETQQDPEPTPEVTTPDALHRRREALMAMATLGTLQGDVTK